MSVTLYREGLPRVEINAPHISGREGMLVGFADAYDEPTKVHQVAAIVMTEDGQLELLRLNQFRVQFHYDVETDQWTDENASEPDQE